jgi:hypothetical protein
MKQLRSSTLFFLLLTLGLFVGTSPVAAALYMDTFTATIGKPTNYGTGFNPYGMYEGQTFSWSIVYDEATINVAGTIRFSGFYPTNQISIAIPRPGTPQIFTQMDDDLYGPGIFDNPYGVFDTISGNFIDLDYVFNQKLLSSPYTGAITVDYYNYLIWFEDGTVNATKLPFDAGYGAFDRQVVPIPGALVLLGSGLAALTILKRRKG